MNATSVTGAVIFIASLSFSVFFYSSLFEWLLHKYVMHKKVPLPFPPWKFDYPFKTHAVIHHHVFKADQSYHLQNEADKHIIPMAWWNGVVLVAISLIPFAITCSFVGHWLAILLGIGLGCGGYYIAYESFHWCMHRPLPDRQRMIEKSWLFRRLNGHHVLHHRYMHKNFNVILPLWDLVLGTLMTRSPLKFNQVRGPSVPDVQPRPKKNLL